MSPDDRNDGFDELLRRTMNDEAETIVPAGDGLSRIQQRVAVRQARLRWLRPTLAMGSAAVVAAGVIGGLAIAKNDDTARLRPDQTPPASSAPPASESPTPSESPTSEPVSNEAFPAQGFFPFENAADYKNWALGTAAADNPWQADPTAVSQTWVQTYLGLRSVDQVVQTMVSQDNKTATVTLGRTMTAEAKRQISVTAVHLVKYGQAWIIVGATDPAAAPNKLVIGSPRPGALATSPLTVSGPGGWGVEEAFQFSVRDGVSSTNYGQAVASSGNGVPTWSTKVTFTQPAGPIGALVGVEMSQADGGPTRIVAEQLTFGEGSSGQSYPPYFYAIKNGRVDKFSTHDGESIEYLTNDTSGGGASDPQLSDDGSRVYYLQGAGTCSNSLMSVTTDSAHTTATVTSPDSGYVVQGYAVGPEPSSFAPATAKPAVAIFEKACAGNTSPQAQLVFTDPTGGHRTIKYPSVPPDIVGDPSFIPGTSAASNPFLDAFVKTGNSGYLAKYDMASDSSPTPTRQACPGWNVNDGLPAALENTDAELWFAVQTGTSMQVVQCAGQHASVAFTVHQNNTPGDVDVTSNGAAVLLTDIDGHVWLWDNTGAPRQLHPSVPLTQVTW